MQTPPFSKASDASYGQFPTVRMRRLRYHPSIRKMVQRVSLDPAKFIMPLFVCEGQDICEPISAMPGQSQLSVNRIADEARLAKKLGLGGILLFGIPSRKDAIGSASFDTQSVVAQAILAAKEAAPDLLVATDLCFCEYTDHGHCGIVSESTGMLDLDNDASLEILTRQAIVHAKAGADLLAPSGMLDGMVGAIRKALDAENYSHLPIMSYAAKYASAFYGPFREAAESAPAFGDRKSYQMDPACDSGVAMREIALDLQEGADIIMVKPALAYLDVLANARQQFPGVPFAAYNVSGEYSMVQAAAAQGWIDKKSIVLESMLAIHRAGADIVLTYWAKELAKWLA